MLNLIFMVVVGRGLWVVGGRGVIPLSAETPDEQNHNTRRYVNNSIIAHLHRTDGLVPAELEFHRLQVLRWR